MTRRTRLPARSRTVVRGRVAQHGNASPVHCYAEHAEPNQQSDGHQYPNQHPDRDTNQYADPNADADHEDDCGRGAGRRHQSFVIQTGSGYSAGGVLTGGNVQIHNEHIISANTSTPTGVIEETASSGQAA